MFLAETWPVAEDAPDVWIEQEHAAQTFFVRTLDIDSRNAFNNLERTGETKLVFLDEKPLREQQSDPNADALAQIIDSIVPGYEGMHVRVQDGTLVIHTSSMIAANGRVSSALESEIEELSGFENVELQHSTPEIPSFRIRGGSSTTSCTAGFAARRPDGAQSGFLSADHCGATQSVFSQPVRTGSSVGGVRTWRSDRRYADIAFYRVTASHTRDTNIWARNHATRNVTSRGRAVVGGSVCSMGHSSGWRCGQVRSVNHRPTSNICLGMTCNPSFVRIQVQSRQGDSGGPWVSGNTGIAITTSISTSNGLHYTTSSCLRFAPNILLAHQ